MATDIEQIAEVIAGTKAMRALRLEVPGHIVDDVTFNVAEQLAAAGFGHVPTALHQAADDIEAELHHAADNKHRLDRDCQGVSPGERVPAVRASSIEAVLSLIRARADRAGGGE